MRFAKAEGCKTEKGEGDTHCRRGDRQVKNCTPAKKGKRERNHGIDGLNSKRTPLRLPHDYLQCPGGATRIPALRAGRIQGYSNSENKIVLILYNMFACTHMYYPLWEVDVSMFDNLALTLAIFPPTGVR